jgi:hypothetical protein
VTIIATGFENKDDPEAVAAPVKEPEIGQIVFSEPDPAPVAEEAPVATVEPTPVEEAPVVEPVPKPAPVDHAPKYDTAGEDSSISEDDFDTIMSIFKNRARRDGNR